MKFSKLIALAGMFAGSFAAVFLSFAGAAHAASGNVAAATAPIAVASAATTTASTLSLPSDSCGLTAADVAKIAVIQNDPTLSSSQEITQELMMRKQLITRIITCAQSDVQALQSALAAAPANSDDAKNVQSQLQGRLNDAANFYSLELGKLSNAGISGSQAIARDVLSWRAGTFSPLSGQVSNFIIWSRNQGLFSTAQSRMDQTKQAVSFLENAAANSDLQNAFNAAYASFQAAKSDNAAAQSALSQSLPPAQSLTLIKQSLDELSGTYQKFSDVSTIIKKLLPQ